MSGGAKGRKVEEIEGGRDEAEFAQMALVNGKEWKETGRKHGSKYLIYIM